MRIIFKDTFVKRLEAQVDYIAKDSPAQAQKFKNELLEGIKEASENPYGHRKSIYFEDPQIRDFIFKGYTIVFRINNNLMEVFGFVKYQKTIF